MVKIEKDEMHEYMINFENIGKFLIAYEFEIEKFCLKYDIFKDGIAVGSLYYFGSSIIIYGSVDVFLDFANMLEAKGYNVIIKCKE